MKIILEFNGTDEEEYANVAMKSTSLYFALYDMDQHLRSKVKYGEEEETRWEEVREDLWDILSKHNITLDELS